MKRVRRAYGLLLLCLLATGCFLLPGKFTSELNLNRDGTFAFTYSGDIHVLALSKMAQDEASRDATFKPLPQCSDSAAAGDVCSDEDEAAQRKTWDAEQATAKARKKDEAAQMQKMLGGIDPADPRAAEELADRLRKQAGWRSVTYMGDGRYAVEYAIAGRLDHDFTFPTVEKLPVVTPFVQVFRRADGTVRVDAPAFSAGASGGPMEAMAAGFAGKEKPTGFPELDGRFTLRTDARILANNTDDGAKPAPGGQDLVWQVNPRTAVAPTALVALDR